jgi:hypothetical protein
MADAIKTGQALILAAFLGLHAMITLEGLTIETMTQTQGAPQA